MHVLMMERKITSDVSYYLNLHVSIVIKAFFYVNTDITGQCQINYCFICKKIGLPQLRLIRG